MKAFHLYVFTASTLLLSSLYLRANQKDDLYLVNKLIDLYPEVDLTKEAILQTEIIAQKYSKDIALILTGKIRYKTNQKSLARQSFTQVSKNSQHFTDCILTYYVSAIDEKVNDSSGVKEASKLFVDNKLWENIEDKDSTEWDTVEKLFKSYADFFRNDRSKMEKLKTVLNELNIVIDLEGEVEALISENEVPFINNWSNEAGKVVNKKKLEVILAKLQDLEFEEKSYEFFTAFPNRARVLVLLGKQDQALDLLEKTKAKIVEYDGLLKEHIYADKKLSRSQKQQALSQMSVLALWHYAKALASFQNYRIELKKSGEKSGDLLFGKYGSAVNFYLCAKKFPENEFSYKSILAYQELREIILKQYSKNLKELSVSNLIQGKAFYTAKDHENAYKYLTKALSDKNELNAYEAYKLAIGTAVKLKKYDDAEKLFAEMVNKYSMLNIAPNDYISRLVNYLAATYLKEASNFEKEDERLSFYKRALKVFELAKENGSRKSNVRIKYLIFSKFLNSISQQKSKAQFENISPLANSLLEDHKLSKESVKALRTLGITHHKLGNTKEAIAYISRYLNRVKSFSSKVDDDQIKMKMLLVELLINEDDLAGADKNLKELLSVKSAFNEELSTLNIRLLYSMQLKGSPEKQKNEYLKKAEEHIHKYKDSKERPFIIAQLAMTYQNINESEKANSLYGILQREYPEHEVNQGTGLNQVLALLKGGQELKALESLSTIDELQSISQTNLYAISVKIYDSLIAESLSKNQADQLLKVLNMIDMQSIENDHSFQKVVLMKSDALVKLKDFEAAEKLLSESLEKYPQGSYMIELNLKLGECLASTGNFIKLSKVYTSLQSKIRRMNGGLGDYSLGIKVSAEFAEYFSKAEDEKYMKKGKYISFLAAQFNAAALKKPALVYLEKVEFWNAWYSKKMNNEDFLELKKGFLTKYPSSKYASELRKL